MGEQPGAGEAGDAAADDRDVQAVLVRRMRQA
jgi:hypothetical protein